MRPPTLARAALALLLLTSGCALPSLPAFGAPRDCPSAQANQQRVQRALSDADSMVAAASQTLRRTQEERQQAHARLEPNASQYDAPLQAALDRERDARARLAETQRRVAAATADVARLCDR